MVDFAAPFDVGFEGDFDSLFSHRFFAGGKDFGIEGVEHVDAEVEPIASVLVAGGESTELGFFFEEADFSA